MSRFFKIFNKIGGFEYLKQLAKCHILLFSLITVVLMGFKQKSMEISRLAINNRRLKKLRKWNKKFIADFLVREEKNKVRKISNKVWVLWLQGMGNAPEIVKICYESLKIHLRNREIILLTEENYRDYVSFPEFIQRKIDMGLITRTHFSDLLRLELLEKFGGTWIDATVYCSGPAYPNYLFDSDLFVFQCLKPGLDGESLRISSWFMSSCSNHPIICLTKALLYNYWRKNNSLIDYFLIHDFFELAIDAYPDEWEKVVPFSNSLPHILLLRLFEPYDERVWSAVKQQTCFHKLTYKFEQNMECLNGTYYENVLKKNCDGD